MSQADRVVRRLLDALEPRIDLDHVARARARQRAALDGTADRPPIVFYLPYEGQEITPYLYPEAYADPAKMMVNELLVGFTSLYHAVDLRDDAPYCLRPNLGTGIIASQFGAEIRLVRDDMPWVMPLGSSEGKPLGGSERKPLGTIERIRAVVDAPLPDVRSGLVARALEQYDYFAQAVVDYPNCRAAFQFTCPDLQGPFSTAELLWGSAIYLAFYDEPDLVRRLLARIADQMIAVYRLIAPHTRDRMGQGYCCQHAVAVKGNLLIRDDSMINLSPKMYRDMVLPVDRHLAEELGGAGVHFCGNGAQQVDNLLRIPDLGSIDLGNPEQLNLDALYQKLSRRAVALVRVSVPESELDAARLAPRFPAGVNLVFKPKSVRHAQALLKQYRRENEFAP